MRLLNTPIFTLINELFREPLSKERCDQPNWRPQNADKKELGFLNDADWAIVGVSRDLRTLLDEVGSNPLTTPEVYQRAAGLVNLADQTLDIMLITQAGLRLSGGILGTGSVPQFCIRKGGQVVECSCAALIGRLESMFTLDDDALSGLGPNGRPL